MLKAAYIQLHQYHADVAAACKGIIFMMDPHCGSASEGLLQWLELLRVSAVSRIARQLAESSAYLQQLERDFEAVRGQRGVGDHKVPILAILETREMALAVSFAL